jgi:hypothetical protein
LYFYEFKESKYLNGVQNFLLNYSSIWVVKTFKQKVLSLKKVYSKGFSSLNLHLRKRFYKSLWNISLIGSKSWQPFISLFSISIMEFLYQEMTIEPISYSVLVAHLSSPIPCWSPTFSWVYSIWAITRSFVLHLYTNSSLLPVHLRQATHLTLKVQNISTHILVWKWFLAHKSFMNFHQ